MSALLELERLRVTLPAPSRTRARATTIAETAPILRDVSFELGEGEAVGLIGRSGSGKTMTARAIVRLLPPGAEAGGTIRFAGRSVLAMDREQLYHYRAGEVAIVFQDPTAHINPVRRIGDFLTEALVLAHGEPRAQATTKVTRLLGETGVDDPERRLRQYPHELSGGQLQRVAIAAALACEPRLLIADEPTTALDVTTQSEVMAMLDELRRERGLALLFITHDLDLAAAVCDRTIAIRDGATVAEPPPARGTRSQGPVLAVTATSGGEPARESSPTLEVRDLRKVFRGGFVAVDDVSFAVVPGGSVAIVGESGSGKTTIARMIVGLQAPSAGAIGISGRPRERPPRGGRERRERGREAQIVFQDNYSSLDPRQRVGDALAEVLNLHFRPSPRERERRVAELLDGVGLRRELARALPRTLSGGERQRAALARALAAEPRLLVLDEAVSSLDVATQAQILDLLAAIRADTGTAYVFISHDLAVVREVSDEVLVLRQGRVVERGATAQIFASPGDPYTRLLLDSVPRPGWRPRRRDDGIGS